MKDLTVEEMAEICKGKWDMSYQSILAYTAMINAWKEKNGIHQ